MARQRFSVQVDAWVTKTKARMEAVRKESAQRVVEIMQTPGPSVANPGATGGGRMPIDSGFLRSSLQGVIGDTLPPVRFKPNGDRKHSYDGGQVNLVIAGSTLGDIIVVAYTANYAKFVEARYAFVRLASQQWPRVVEEVVREAKSRAGS